MNKKPPSQITVGAYTISVDVDPIYMKKVSEENGSELAGISEIDQLKITMDDHPYDYNADTLLHEIIHVCFRVAACDVNEEVKQNRKMDVEERVTSALTNVLLDTLRRNPELVKYLLGK